MSEGDRVPGPTSRQPSSPSTPPPSRPKASKCPCCGHHTLRPTAKAHRFCRYRLVVLMLPAGLLVPTCSRCKHSILSFDSVPGLAAVLEAAYRSELMHRAAVEIAHLGQFYSQRRIERELDLSQGYLSRLRAGDGVPSAALVSLLALLRAEPRRLEELKTYWALPLPSDPPSPKRKQDA